jgi:hypothetical protein
MRITESDRDAMVEPISLVGVFKKIIITDFDIQVFFQDSGGWVPDGPGTTGDSTNPVFRIHFIRNLVATKISISSIRFCFGKDFEHFGITPLIGS